MIDRIRSLLALKDEDLGRILAFFSLYLLIFATLTLADGLSISMLVKRVGAESLPYAYAAVAVANLVAIGLYVRTVERVSGTRMLQGILTLTGGSLIVLWWLIHTKPEAPWYGVVFTVREVAYTLLLMHFGTVVQSYFTRAHLVRSMPLIYAGGRVGGLLGGGVLSVSASRFALPSLLLMCAGIALFGVVATGWVARRYGEVDSRADNECSTNLRDDKERDLDRNARTGLRSFLHFVHASPLMRWHTVASILFVICRLILNYQHNTYFEGHFADESAFASFLGTYVMIALVLSLVMQLVVINRMVAWFGLKAAQLGYGLTVVGAMLLNTAGMDLSRAIFSRLVERELRFGWRNPLNQLVINKFSRPLRVRVRAWSMGMLIPGSTIAASSMLAGLTAVPAAIAATGLGFGLAYLTSLTRMNRTWSEKPRFLFRNPMSAS